MIDLSRINSLGGWRDKRTEIETAIQSIIGAVPEKRVEPQMKVTEEYETRGLTRKRVNFFVRDDELVSGWLFIPDGKDESPAVLCCHGKTPHGKDEPAGIDGNHRLSFAQHYAERGYVTFAMDAITTGERTSVKRQAFDTEVFYRDHPHMSLAGKMLADHMHAIDVFAEVKRVDATRIGVVGHGLGGFNALLLAACDNRVQACVASCGFTRFSTDKKPGCWAGDESLVLVPKIAQAKADALEFDWEHILAFAAPTALQVITSVSESVHANPKSCQKAVTQASKVYKLLGAHSAINHYTHHDGDEVTPETLEVADEWFERWL